MRSQKEHSKHRMSEDPEKPKGLSALSVAFTLICLGLAAVWPGALFHVLGDDDPSLYLIKVSAILIAALFIPVLLLIKIPALTGRIPGRLILFGVFISFLAALLAGNVSPQIRAFQEDAFVPAFTPYLAKLKTIMRENEAVHVSRTPLKAQNKSATKKPDGQNGAALRKNLENLPLMDKRRYDNHLAIGDAYLEKKQYDQAIAAYDQASQISPTGIKAITNRADAVRLKSHYDMALSKSNLTIEIHPDESKGYLSRGQTHMGHGQYDLAIADFDRVIQLNPDDAQAFESRAHSHFKKGLYDQAIADFSKAIELESSPGR